MKKLKEALLRHAFVICFSLGIVLFCGLWLFFSLRGLAAA